MAASTLINALVAYWTLDALSGDLVGVNGNVLNRVNNVLTVPGLLGNAASIDRANNRYLQLAIGDLQNFQPFGSSFSVAAWINPNSLPAATTMAIISQSGNPGNFGWLMEIDGATHHSQMRASPDGTAITIADNTTAPTIATWNLFIGWVDPDLATLNMQVNNGAVTSIAYAGPVFASTHALQVGASNNGAVFDGLIDEVFYAGRVWTAAERSSIWNGGVGQSFPFTAILYSASRTTTQSVPVGQLTGKRLSLFVNVSDASGGGSITPGLQVFDSASGKYFTVWTAAAPLTTNGLRAYYFAEAGALGTWTENVPFGRPGSQLQWVFTANNASPIIYSASSEDLP